MLEYPIAQMYADARVQRIYGGANEIMKELDRALAVSARSSTCLRPASTGSATPTAS